LDDENKLLFEDYLPGDVIIIDNNNKIINVPQ
jgi:hypothetical protein